MYSLIRLASFVFGLVRVGVGVCVRVWVWACVRLCVWGRVFVCLFVCVYVCCMLALGLPAACLALAPLTPLITVLVSSCVFHLVFFLSLLPSCANKSLFLRLTLN